MTPGGYNYFSLQLIDEQGRNIITAGGVVKVCDVGDAAEVTLYSDKNGTALANPFAPTRGHLEFFTPIADTEVDLYIMAPGGQFVVVTGVKASGQNEIRVDTSRLHHVMVIPFNQSEFTANTETDTGFDEPSNALMLPNPSVRVATIDATETLDVGTLSTDSGDADGFLAAVSLGTAGLVKGTVVNGSNTMGALFEVQDSGNAGDIAPEARVSAGKSITITTSAGSDTGKGFIYLPYQLCA